MHVGGPQSAQLQVVRSSSPSTIYTTLLQIIPDLLVTGALGQVHSLVLEGRGDDVYRTMVDGIVALGQFGWVGQTGFIAVFAGELTNSEGIEHKFEVEQVDDQTYPKYDQVPHFK